MVTLTDYFKSIAYHPTYFMGDRVTGTWHKIPFTGTVASDTRKKEDSIPQVDVWVDLPVKHKNEWKEMITVKHKDIKLLPKFKL